MLFLQAITAEALEILKYVQAKTMLRPLAWQESKDRIRQARRGVA